MNSFRQRGPSVPREYFNRSELLLIQRTMSSKEQDLVTWDVTVWFFGWLWVKMDGMVLFDSFFSHLPKSPLPDAGQVTL